MRDRKLKETLGLLVLCAAIGCGGDDGGSSTKSTGASGKDGGKTSSGDAGTEDTGGDDGDEGGSDDGEEGGGTTGGSTGAPPAERPDAKADAAALAKLDAKKKVVDLTPEEGKVVCRNMGQFVVDGLYGDCKLSIIEGTTSEKECTPAVKECDQATVTGAEAAGIIADSCAQVSKPAKSCTMTVGDYLKCMADFRKLYDEATCKQAGTDLSSKIPTCQEQMQECSWIPGLGDSESVGGTP